MNNPTNLDISMKMHTGLAKETLVITEGGSSEWKLHEMAY